MKLALVLAVLGAAAFAGLPLAFGHACARAWSRLHPKRKEAPPR